MVPFFLQNSKIFHTPPLTSVLSSLCLIWIVAAQLSCVQLRSSASNTSTALHFTGQIQPTSRHSFCADDWKSSAVLCCHGSESSLIAPRTQAPFSPTYRGNHRGQQLSRCLESLVLLAIRAIKCNPDKKARRKKFLQIPAVLKGEAGKKTFWK